MNVLVLFISLALLSVTPAWAQVDLSGIITDDKEKPLEGAIVIIRGTSQRTVSKADGTFSFRTTESLPFTITVSAIGHNQGSVKVKGNNFRRVVVELTTASLSTDQHTTAVSRISGKIEEAALTVYKLGPSAFRQSPALSPFNTLKYVTGVDFLTQTLLFTSVNTRGFGSTNNNRFLQLTDGMDNRSPGLGFGFGNVAGLPDLDVESIDLVPGASSALYGPDAMQGRG